MALEAAAVPADGGALTVDQSIAAQLAGMEKEDDAVEQPIEAVPETDTEAAPDAAEGVGEAEEPSAGDEEAAEPEAPEAPIEPPQFWSAEAKARFRDVPRDLQELILAEEHKGRAFTSKAAQESVEKAKAAEAERARFAQRSEQLNTLLPKAEQTFADKWANVDWVLLTAQRGAEEATALRFQYEAERDQLASLRAAQAETQQVALAEFRRTEDMKLASMRPELVDRQEGQKRFGSLIKYIVEENGIALNEVRAAPAAAMNMAWKAQQYDLAQAKAKALATAKPQPAKPAVAKPVPSKPGASVSSQSLQSAAVADAEKAFNANSSVENAVKLQLAQDRARRK